jgi:HAMP domain-containing protein
MKTAGIVVLILLLAGCAAGLIITSQSLGETQERLEAAEVDLSRAQAEQQDIAQSLEETRDELQDTANSLEETKRGLEEQKEQTNKYLQLYESSAAELENREEELDTLEDKLASAEQENSGLQKNITELEEKLALYEDTLGTHVYSGVMPPYHSGNTPQIILSNQGSAVNPTWEELLDFLKEDKTDSKLYVTGEYECGNFAQDLHNRAEAHGIRAAFVAVHFYDAPSHALNAYKTTDRGLVYIDDTGDKVKRAGVSLDRLVELAKDDIYNTSFLFPAYLSTTPEDRKVESIEIYW